MRIHHPAAVRAVAFSPVSAHSRHVACALDNGSMHRWDLTMGQRGQLDRVPVAHSGPILSLDWVLPSAASPTMLSSTRQSGASNWYGTGTGFFEDILPSVPIASAANAPAADADTSSQGWIFSGGMDRCVKGIQFAMFATRICLTRSSGMGFITPSHQARLTPTDIHPSHIFPSPPCPLASGV